MNISSIFHHAAKGLLLAVVLTVGVAMAQSAEPTLNQVYATAQAGKLDDAQLMIQQVLIGHPKSAKAHFVRAELFARQGDLVHARESLATADRLSPGLSFAKPEAVTALRTQLTTSAAPKTGGSVSTNRVSGNAVSPAPSAYAAPAATSSSSSWGLPLLLAGAAIVAGYFIFRRRNPAPVAAPASYAPQNGLNGPQSFGMGGAGAMQPAGYPPQGGYAPQQGTGLGGRIMGGVATGLAVGAGVMAAEAIGRNLMGNHNAASAGQLDNAGRNDYQPIGNSTPVLGGAVCGISDTGSWDGGSDGGGGGDWDN